MKFKRLFSLFVALAMMLTFLTLNVTATNVPQQVITPAPYTLIKNTHHYEPKVDCYSMSSYSIHDVCAYSFMTASVNGAMELNSVVMINIQYTDGTIESGHLKSDTQMAYKRGDGIQPYTEAVYNTEKTPLMFEFWHFYYLDGPNIHNENYQYYYGYNLD